MEQYLRRKQGIYNMNTSTRVTILLDERGDWIVRPEYQLRRTTEKLYENSPQIHDRV